MTQRFTRFIRVEVSKFFLRVSSPATQLFAPCWSIPFPEMRSKMTTLFPTTHLRACAFALTLCSLVSGAVQGQMPDFAPVKPIHQSLKTCQGAACKTISDSLSDRLEALLGSDEAPERQGSKPDFLAAVTSSDGRLMVLTWNWPQADRTSSYAGLVAFRPSDREPWEFTRLYDANSADAPNLQRAVSADEWWGALYYDMVPDPVDKDTWLLLGWDDADAQVTRKVIEPLEWRSRGLRFGAPVLDGPRGMTRRWVLEYADAVQVSLRYQPAAKGKQGHPERILFDHLAPSEPHLTGITAFYGPDMTFDAFVPGKKPTSPWPLLQNVDAIQSLPGDRPFVDPRPRNRR